MTFDWRTNLELARDLHQWRSGNEAVDRCIVGPCYYAVHGGARERYLQRRNLSFAATIGHEEIWRFIATGSDPSEREVSIIGTRLMRLRHQADYDEQMKTDPADAAQEALDDASRLLQQVMLHRQRGPKT